MKIERKINMSRSSKQNLILLALLVIAILFFASQNPLFLTTYNLTGIVRQNLPEIIIACAMMFVIASGAIDLSVGGVMALSAIVYGHLCLMGVNPWLAILVVIPLGMFIGFLNSFIFQRLGIPAIMATMATWLITSSLALTLVRAIPISEPEVRYITVLNRMRFFNNLIPLAVFIVLAIVLIFLFLEKKTLLGKYAIAIGGNSQATELSGINVWRVRMIFFMLCSTMAATAGVWQVARMGSADPKIGVGTEFSVISACILGGVNIKGGSGTVTGVLIGSCLLFVLTNGMRMMGINTFYQQVVVGIVLLSAVLINSIVDMKSMKRKPALMKEVASKS